MTAPFRPGDRVVVTGTVVRVQPTPSGVTWVSVEVDGSDMLLGVEASLVRLVSAVTE